MVVDRLFQMVGGAPQEVMLSAADANPGIVERVTALEDKVVPASTSKMGLVRLNNTVTSASTAQAATANAVKMAYDKAVEAKNAVTNKVSSDAVPSYAAPDFMRYVIVNIPAQESGDSFVVPADGFIDVRYFPSLNVIDGINFYYIRSRELDNKVILSLSGNNSYATGGVLPVKKGMNLCCSYLYVSSIEVLFIPSYGSIWSD